MSRCTRHNVANCRDYACRNAYQGTDLSDNTGDVSIGVNDGDLNIGIGGGLTVDTATGDLGVEIAPGIALDF